MGARVIGRACARVVVDEDVCHAFAHETPGPPCDHLHPGRMVFRPEWARDRHRRKRHARVEVTSLDAEGSTIDEREGLVDRKTHRPAHHCVPRAIERVGARGELEVVPADESYYGVLRAVPALCDAKREVPGSREGSRERALQTRLRVLEDLLLSNR